MNAAHFFEKGWTRFPYDPGLAEWAAATHPLAVEIAADPDWQARWLRCGGTWFAGVNALPNDDAGAVPDHGIPPLRGEVLGFIHDVLGLGGFAWDPAQLSVCYPGYPQPWEGESEAAFRFRRDRDAAHMDGLKRSDPGRRRALNETHGFILGIPLTEADPEAAPFTVWEGSHELMRTAFRARLAGISSADWVREDVTEAYTEARRTVFDTCHRVKIAAKPGEAYLVHRLALHGVAPWDTADTRARRIAYFRPDVFPGAAPDWWLERP